MLDKVEIYILKQYENKFWNPQEIIHGYDKCKRIFEIYKVNDYDIGILRDNYLDNTFILNLLKQLEIEYTYRIKHGRKWYGLYSNKDYEKIKMYFQILGIIETYKD
jgi:hypothetical protein